MGVQQDEGLPPIAPVAEIPGEDMAGGHEDQYPTEEQESDTEETPKRPAGDMTLPPEAKKTNHSAKGPNLFNGALTCFFTITKSFRSWVGVTSLFL